MVEHKKQRNSEKRPSLKQQAADAYQRQQAELPAPERRGNARNPETALSRDTARQTSGVITGVFADLMIFVEVPDGGGTLDLVFKPNKIANYHGESLEDLGIQAGVLVSEIQWDSSTRQVSSVVLSDRATRLLVLPSA